MNRVFFIESVLNEALARGVAASFIETRSADSRGSTYTSARIEVLVTGEKWAQCVAIVTRTSGGYDYASQLARDALNKSGVAVERFTFESNKTMRNTDHFDLLKYTPMVAAEDLKGKGE